jgi:hypothetical protein
MIMLPSPFGQGLLRYNTLSQKVPVGTPSGLAHRYWLNPSIG